MAEYEGRPDLQRLMIPRYPPYGKRMLRDNGVWARALKQPHVTVVGERIERITRDGVVTADGAEYELDVIVYCTGFQAWRFLDGTEVTGRGERTCISTGARTRPPTSASRYRVSRTCFASTGRTPTSS